MTREMRPPFAAAASIASVIGSTSSGHAETVQEASPFAPVTPAPTLAQQVWQDCEIGLPFCFDLPIAAGIYYVTRTAASKQRQKGGSVLMIKLVVSIAVCAGVSVPFPPAGQAADSSEGILAATGVKGGLVVHLGCGAPLSILDAASGQTIKTCDGAKGTDEILWHDDMLALCVRPVKARLRRRSSSPETSGRICSL